MKLKKENEEYKIDQAEVQMILFDLLELRYAKLKKNSRVDMKLEKQNYKNLELDLKKSEIQIKAYKNQLEMIIKVKYYSSPKLHVFWRFLNQIY